MPQLRLLGFYCVSNNDPRGLRPDEPYINVLPAGGNLMTKHWSAANVSVGNALPISVALVTFNNYIDITMLESDTGELSPDDQISQPLRVPAGTAGQGVKVHQFEGDDANYWLYYEVV